MAAPINNCRLVLGRSSLFLSLILLLTPALLAADAPAGYTRFCATCGLKDVKTFVSQSGQFVVHGGVAPGFVPRRTGTNAAEFITAEPQLVAMMGERVARAIAQDLRLPGRPADKVHAAVFDLAPPGQAIGLLTQVHTDGFQYKLAIPGQVEGQKLMKALLQVLLLEYANWGHRRSAELPTWLVEGMLRQIQTGVVPTYVVNRKPITVEKSGYDRLGETRNYLQTNAPLTLQDLSFANLSRVSSDEIAKFEASAHLLVHELMRLKGGPHLMARFLRTLPSTLNWQTAFYSVYKEHFDGPLAFEKWWLMNWLRFRNGEERETWPVEMTLERLESVIYTTMEMRSSTNSIPQYRDAPLQELLQLADFATQKEILGQKVQHLYLMSVNVPAEASELWMGYHRALDNYMQKRSNDTQPTLKTDPEQKLQTLLRTTLKRLDELDAARAELKVGRPAVIQNEAVDSGGTNRQARR